MQSPRMVLYAIYWPLMVCGRLQCKIVAQNVHCGNVRVENVDITNQAQSWTAAGTPTILVRDSIPLSSMYLCCYEC